MAEATQPEDRMVVCYFIVSDDVERSRRFYTDVLGGTVVFGPEPTNVALANSFIVINAGGGPTDDKPTVTLEAPHDPDRVSSFLNLRVRDIHAVYAEWSARGAQFLTPPKQHQYEIRCYIRDPDGYLIEVGQTTDPQGDWLPADWSPIQPRRAIRLNPSPRCHLPGSVVLGSVASVWASLCDFLDASKCPVGSNCDRPRSGTSGLRGMGRTDRRGRLDHAGRPDGAGPCHRSGQPRPGCSCRTEI